MAKQQTKEEKVYALNKELIDLGGKRQSHIGSLKIIEERLQQITKEIQELVK